MPRVVPRTFPSRYHVGTRLDFFEEPGDLIRIVLQVGIHGKYELPRSTPETSRQRSRFSSVAAKSDAMDGYALIASLILRNALDRLPSTIATPVVDQNQFTVVLVGR